MDVICSTSSIFNLVAISIDRYMAVTHPIKYAKQKNNSRAWVMILIVWIISTAIGLPIVLGLNYTPNRVAGLCIFYNTDFIIYSSLSSFYIPCVIMVFLYYSIFKALRNREKKQRAARKPHLDMKPGIVIENVAQTRRLAETSMVASALVPTTSIDDGPTNTGSGSQEEDDDGERSPGSEDCHVIPNDKSTEFILATVIEETAAVGALGARPVDEKGNNDSGYAASHQGDAAHPGSPPTSPHHHATGPPDNTKAAAASAAMTPASSIPRRNGSTERSQPPAPVRRTLSASIRTSSEDEGSGSKKERKASAGTRFTIYKVNKASRKKREKSSARKERKATKTLAIVLGVFLFCWVPFFTCNIMGAICTKLESDCTPSLNTFLVTTWLGYINSSVNPVIYTIFNPEFRKAFNKIMMIGT